MIFVCLILFLNFSLFLECSSSHIDTKCQNAENLDKKNCYIKKMRRTGLLKIYDLEWKWHFLFYLLLFLALTILRKQALVLFFFRPAMAATFLLVLFHIICRGSKSLTDYIVQKTKIIYPSFVLWLYPTVILLKIAFFAFILIILSRNLWGRGFFSSLLKLNGQETTSFISTCFSAMIIFVAFQFVFASYRVIRWIAASSYRRVATLNLLEATDENFSATIDNTVKELKRETDYLKEQRNKAAKINRIALIILFLCLIMGSLWLIFYRPAVILYYRAEFQLKTFVNPATAYNTLEHLSSKFPDYRYLDSVKYRMAWILDRRMNKSNQAFDAYVDFIENYSPDSVWIDEALINLVYLTLDKLNRPEQTLKWSKKYLELYPDGIMRPHMHLYRIRAYARLSDLKSAEKEIKLAKNRYSGKTIQIFNKEDRLVEIINFDDALKVEISQIKGLK